MGNGQWRPPYSGGGRARGPGATAQYRRGNVAAGQPRPALPSPQDASHVEQVIRQLSHGNITDAEKQQLATALMPETMGALQLRVDAQTTTLSDSLATAAEALTIAVVASSAAKRLGEREVLAIRMLGILVLAVGGMVTLLTELRQPIGCALLRMFLRE